MRNKDNESNVNRNVGIDSEQSRNSGSSDFGSSPGRSSERSLENESSSSSNISRSDKSPGRSGSGSLGNTDSSEGRH